MFDALKAFEIKRTATLDQLWAGLVAQWNLLDGAEQRSLIGQFELVAAFPVGAPVIVFDPQCSDWLRQLAATALIEVQRRSAQAAESEADHE